MADTHQLLWLKVSDAYNMLWKDNPKLHDIGAIVQSLEKYGLQELPKYEANLTNVAGGKGAIVAGNGRIEALYQMERNNANPPKGIVLNEDGEWTMPVLAGVDLGDEILAMSYAIDSNNLVLSGGDYSIDDIVRMWSPDVANVAKAIYEADGDIVSIPDPDDFINYWEKYFENHAKNRDDAEILSSLQGLEDYKPSIHTKIGNVYCLFRTHYFVCSVPFEVKNYFQYLTPDTILIFMPSLSCVCSTYLSRATRPVVFVQSNVAVADFILTNFIRAFGDEAIELVSSR